MVKFPLEINSMSNNKVFIFGRFDAITYKNEVAPKKTKPQTTEEVTNRRQT
jgi:hypothetical protein